MIGGLHNAALVGHQFPAQTGLSDIKTKRVVLVFAKQVLDTDRSGVHSHSTSRLIEAFFCVFPSQTPHSSEAHADLPREQRSLEIDVSCSIVCFQSEIIKRSHNSVSLKYFLASEGAERGLDACGQLVSVR